MANTKQSRAGYMRDYRQTLKRTRGFEENRLFDAGVKAMREATIQAFRRIASAEMNGWTAADIVRQITVPRGNHCA